MRHLKRFKLYEEAPPFIEDNPISRGLIKFTQEEQDIMAELGADEINHYDITFREREDSYSFKDSRELYRQDKPTRYRAEHKFPLIYDIVCTKIRQPDVNYVLTFKVTEMQGNNNTKGKRLFIDTTATNIEEIIKYIKKGKDEIKNLCQKHKSRGRKDEIDIKSILDNPSNLKGDFK
jgi:hypothetical protein